MHLQYRARALALTLVLASCSTSTPVATPTAAPGSPSPAAVPSASPSPSAPLGLAEKPMTIVLPGRRWQTVPDGAFHDPAAIAVTFPAVDAAPGMPRARIDAAGAPRSL